MKEGEREVLTKILLIEEEEGRRARARRLDEYNKGEKVHRKQLEFHRSTARNRWVFGGNRSGKTECGAVEALWIALGRHPYRKNRANRAGWVVSVSFDVQKEVAQAKILHYLDPKRIERITMYEGSKETPETGIIDTLYIKNDFGGISRITFKSAEAGREKFQGASLDFVWFDEEPPEEVYRECAMRVMDRGGDLFGTMTPLKGMSWVYDEIYLSTSPDVYTVTMEWADNPFLPQGEVERLTASMSKEELEQRRYGRFAAKEGLVYPEFSLERHVCDPFPLPQSWQSMISIDPGLNNPLSAHFYYVDPEGVVYVAAEHYERGRDVDYHAKRIQEIATALHWKRDEKGRLSALIDSAARQRTLSSPKNLVEMFAERGILVNTRVNKDLFRGINAVKHYFSATPPAIRIFRTCPNLIRELKGYRWGEEDKPIKKDDHALDELRYFLLSRPPLPCAAPPEPPSRALKHFLALSRATTARKIYD